jgi:(1->4)-alpha-D-glucan 1-alpha-D-glucosylmutase
VRTPASTYRLQITAAFDLFEAARRLPYLHDLGADWVYLSPVLEAEAGSEHGYDVVAHDRVDESRGGAAGLAAVSAEARRLGMGVLVDIVPNHVGIATPLPGTWWWDVLRLGQESPHAAAFDVDWVAGGGRLVVPILGDDADLTSDLKVEGDQLRYYEHAFPIAPGTGEGSPAEVHDRQHYRLVSWREADAGLNYRRFFAINTLAAVRVEDRAVFDATHVEIKRWFDEGLVDGLRVDHPDGLREPGHYLDDLAELTGGAYVLVEKILEPGEELPTSWATAGTTGYDALAHIDRVLTDPQSQPALDALESQLRGAPVDWHQLIHDTKRAVADGILNSEVRRICRELGPPLVEPVETTAEKAGTEPPALVDAVAELMACFPVYRSYLPEGRSHLDEAFALAREQRPDLEGTLGDLEPVLADPDAPAAKRFQQTSGMVMAKGVEDCAFYRYSRLTSLNEVGGDPSVFSLDVPGFHEAMTARQAGWPDAMTTLSTHDTKRSEDVRARITALAEAPGLWSRTLDTLLEAVPLPDPGFASLLWQAAYGAWPISRERLHAYAEKAMREAGDHTTWTDPDAAYEKAVHGAVDAAYDDDRVRGALEALDAELAEAGRANALAAKLVSLTIPGVPDVYQGSELGDLSLVDPDNRRPVDFDAAATSLADGSLTKQAVTAQALRLRRDRPELFTGYTPLYAEGPAADHVLAFDRGGAVTVVTRLPLGLAAKGGWGDTTLTLADGTHRVADLLGDAPVALIVLGADS